MSTQEESTHLAAIERQTPLFRHNNHLTMKLTNALQLFLATESVRAFSTQSTSRFGLVSSSKVGRSSSTKPTAVWGILDEVNSDAFDLSSLMASNEDDSNLSEAYEMMLAELVFSTNDPRLDIVERFDLVTDPAFLEFLSKKTEKSTDADERLALRDLHEMILDVKNKVEVSRLAEERAQKEAEEAERQRVAAAEAQADEGRALSTAEVLKRANAIDQRTSEETIEARKQKKSFYDEELTPEIRLSYEPMIKKVLPPYKAGDTPSSIVYKFYDQFDAQFVKVLAEREQQGCTDSKAILEALAVEQQKHLAAAAESLKRVLAAGEPQRMEGAIIKMAREGKIDEAFLLLLEANEQQAKDAGALGPAELMSRLKKRAIDEKDKQAQSKEIRLLRKLLRTDDAAEREKILEDAFTPKDTLIVPGTMENARKAVDGEAPDQEQPMPDVPPPDFINACKAVLINFGNIGSDDIERGDLASRIKKLASEAEVVATRIYGKGMTVKEQQDRAWAEQTTSIFDLERMEIEAERMGERAPWTNPDADDDMFLPGFDSMGRMQVGGGN